MVKNSKQKAFTLKMRELRLRDFSRRNGSFVKLKAGRTDDVFLQGIKWLNSQ